MIVCLCNGVSERTVESAIHEGARSVAEVSLQCGAGAGCGACHCQISEQIDRTTCSAKMSARLSISSLPILKPARSAA